MNWDIVQGKWKELKGEARKQWGKITDDEFEQATAAEGAAWAETEIPPKGQLTDLRPDGYEGRIYYGEQFTEYTIIGQAARKRNIQIDRPQPYHNYAGER